MKKALFVALWVAVGITAMAQVTLSFNPAKGDKFKYQTEVIQKINQDIMGQQIEMDHTMRMEYTMNIINKTATGIEAEFEYKSIFFNMASSMMNMKYDSENPSSSATGMDEMIAKIFGSILNKKFITTIEKDGSVTSVTGMEVIITDMMKAVNTDDMIGQQLAEQMRQQFSDEAIMGSFEQVFNVYPAGSVKAGDSWVVKHSSGQAGMELNIDNTYTLASVTGEKAMTNINATIDGMGGQMKGTQTGTVEFDLKSGLPLKSNMVQTIKGTISASGMEIPMDLTTNVNSTVTKE